MKVIGIGAGKGANHRCGIKALMPSVGVTGITLAYQAHTAAQRFDLVVYEKADEVGGNWYWNQ
jgi:hypothetical protein